MIKAPKKEGIDTTFAIAKGLLSTIPVAGGLLAEIGALFVNPIEKRRGEWVEDVSKALNQIRTELDLLPEQLQENEHFISTLLQASEAAMRTHHIDKRAALRNALISSAAPVATDDEETAIFIRYIDELSPVHLKVLHHLNHQSDQLEELKELEHVYSLLVRLLGRMIERSLFRTIIQDLDTRFLIRLGDLEELSEFKSKRRLRALGQSGVRAMSVTERGKDFLSYIRADQI